MFPKTDCKECAGWYNSCSPDDYADYIRDPDHCEHFEPIVKTKEELGDTLCEFCPRDENRRRVYSVPGGFCAGGEGQNCNDAYEAYCEEKTELYRTENK